MRKTIARSAGLLLTAVLLTANLAGSALAAETGSISGTFTDRVGAAMPGVGVTLTFWTAPGTPVMQTTTDSAGHYSFTSITTGIYRVQFAPTGYLPQYAFQAKTIDTATLVEVSNGSLSIVDDHLMAYGTFTGRVTAADGTGLPNHPLTVHGTVAYTVMTDADGYYTAKVWPETWRFSFPVPGTGEPRDRITQHIPGTDLASEAQRTAIAADETITVNDTVMATGYLSGTFTNETGNPLASVTVRMEHFNAPSLTYVTSTDSEGNWMRRVKAGTDFWVWFISSTQNVNQYAYSKVSKADADHLSVQSGQTLKVNDSRMATGSLRVTARDAVTGQPLQTFTTTLSPAHGEPDNTPGDGVQIITKLFNRSYFVTVSAWGYSNGVGSVSVVAGQETSIDVQLQPTTRIDATVVDAQTGLPVAGVCLYAGTLEKLQLDNDYCKASDADGHVIIDLLYEGPGNYQVLAVPPGGGPIRYGAQWVGPNGGVGSQKEAATIVVTAGQATQAPLIKLDRAGAVTGHVEPNGLGGPGWVSLTDTNSAHKIATVPVDANGNYTIDFLGPYAWPLRFETSYGHWQYSGGVGGRHDAERIKVTSGGTATYNFTFRPLTSVDIHLPYAGTECHIEMYNAGSGEWILGWGSLNCPDSLRFTVADKQFMKTRVTYLEGGEYKTVWHGGHSFATGLAVKIDGPTSFTFDPVRHLPMPEPAPSQVPVPTQSAPAPPHTPRPRESY